MGLEHYRFAAFHVDFRAMELRKHGLKVKLQEQPLRILQALLERPGELITREELRERLWPKDLYVDFERNLTSAMNKLRAALNDSAEKPRYIETLPRRGYRFIAPVSGNGISGEERPEAPINQIKVPQTARKHLPYATVLVTAAVLPLAAIAYWLRPSLPAPRVLRTVQLTNDHRLKTGAVVTDGLRVYFSERIGAYNVPVSIPISGGEAVPIPLPFKSSSSMILDISPDGAELLLGTAKFWTYWGGDLWVVPTTGGVPRRLGDLVAIRAVWSPDGRRILYDEVGDKGLYVVNADGTDSRVLVDVPGRLEDFHWSPDGGRISVSVGTKDSMTLWEVSADGTNLHPVIAGWDLGDDSRRGQWTADGRYFLFDSCRGGPDNIWMIREKESFFYKTPRTPVELTAGPSNIGNPVPSRDGKRIFVVSREEGPGLHRYDSKSGEWEPFLSGLPGEHVDISRDSQWVTYITFPDANLFRSRLDGSQKLQLTSPPVQAAMPRFSPGGKDIAYMARTPGASWRIWLVSLAGGNAHQLTSDGLAEVEPTWSPDGRYLAFQGATTSNPEPAIQVFEVESQKIWRIPAQGNLDYPRWSPDGHKIATIGGNFHKIMVFDLRTRKWEVVVQSSSVEPVLYEPNWSHDGQYVYFIDWTGSKPGYYRVRLNDHRVGKIVALDDDFPGVKGSYGGWHGLTPDDSLIALMETEYGEIYALDWDAP